MGSRSYFNRCAGIAFAACLFSAHGSAQTYTAVDLGAIWPESINASGQIAGDNFATKNAFFMNNLALTDLGALGPSGSQTSAMNNLGQVVGQTSTSALPHAFLYSGGKMTDLGTLPGGSESQAFGINNLGQIVGWSQTSGKTHGFLYSNGSFTDLGVVPGGTDSQATAINDKGQIVLRAYTIGGPAFIYTNGAWVSIGLSNYSYSQGTSINSSGQVAGWSQNVNTNNGHAFLYSNGVTQDLGTLGGSLSMANGLNNSGAVVGSSFTSTSNVVHAFLYSGGTMTDLNSLVSVPGGAYLNSAWSINDYGEIVATASNGHGYLIATSFGHIDTPANNVTGLAGAVSVTGWTLSHQGIKTIALWREPVVGETPSGNGLIFVQNAISVPGTRPDVANAYPGYPCNNCGFGTQILTNVLPDSSGGANGIGNGTYVVHVLVTNNANAVVDLGTVTMSVDNKDSVAPFGAVDFPGEGATASGTYAILGWALTPLPSTIPLDGHTIAVYVDGVQLSGHPAYSQPRPDVRMYFPNLNNSNGPGGTLNFDTTKYTNGLHTVFWVVTDNNGHAAGIGSHFFNIQN